ncbi:N-methyl-L-tryptophan oxidase [Arthrospiribacter ruber]|uniref:N-methyl-L-tryptophan oxidase n=1 Tax=Arthrospiribacter ruber TaxID=2487934 RepID=A0A951IXY8_9BACT|nr:N-methyl-L-tryptophan oxidase [Arthrospiribacter ruber]MBW3469260.1 N-methyl-L-tryptophan oxidase [Arthrospiribacter ruber]
MSKTYDIAVIGLGALGSSALWQLSKSGKSILGLDQFSPPHDMGSSHGESRITRLAVGEGQDFIPIVKRSHKIWQELEKLSGKQVYFQTGGLLFDTSSKAWSKHGSEGFFERTLAFAQSADIKHEVLDGKKVKSVHPEFCLDDHAKAYFEPSAGVLKPELAIQTQLDLAASNGAVIKAHYKVIGIRSSQHGVQILTNHGDFEARKVLISAGPWVKDFLPEDVKYQFKICRQVLYWLPVTPGFYELGKTPVFMWGFGPRPEDFIYGFPSLDGQTAKIASESFLESHHPDTLNRTVSENEGQLFLEEKIKDKFKGLRPEIIKSKVCIYTVTEDSNFVVDELPDFPEVLVASACSGHGFKHSAGLGEAIAQKLLNQKSDIDISPFQWK